MQSNIKLEISYLEATEITPYADNSRTHTQDQIDQIKASIAEFGMCTPIGLHGGVIVYGHARFLAMKQLGYDQFPCLDLSHLTKAQRKAYIIADNQLALNAGWDLDILKVEIERLDELDFDTSLLGFDADFLNDLTLEETEGLTDEDAVPEVPEIPVTVLGDIWLLGNHRVMCGDSTSIDAVEKLMDGKKADICFTSPPYNIANSPTEKDGLGKYIKGKSSDDKSRADYVSFLDDFTKNALTVTDFVFSNIQGLSNNKVALIEHLYNLKEFYADTMIWKKGVGQPAMARRVLNSAFEYIYIFSNNASRAIGMKDFRGTIPNIFELSPNAVKEFAKIHKATFRLELPELFINWFVETSVYDPFGGTGTTLIACQKSNKSCSTMELDEKYCDVIINRWQDFTGKEATHAESGKTYAQLKAKPYE